MLSPNLILNSANSIWAGGEFHPISPEKAILFGVGLDPTQLVDELHLARLADPSAFVLDMDHGTKCLPIGTVYFDCRYSQRATVVHATADVLWAKLEKRDELERMSIDSFRYNQRAGQYVYPML